MKKKLTVVFILLIFTVSGSYALNLSLGINGALYMGEGEYETWNERFGAFQDGEGIYYGLMAELLGENVGLGFNYFASFYESSFGVEMMDTDVNLNLSYHLLGATTFLDPFGEIGIGMIAKDYADSEFRGDNPLTATGYWDAGLGLGINLGNIGIFGKYIYHFSMGAPTVEEEVVDDNGDPVTVSYDLEEYALKPYKFVLGAKIIF